MYTKIFEKCGLRKGSRYVVKEYVDGGYKGVKSVWVDTARDIEYVVFQDGRILKTTPDTSEYTNIDAILQEYGC